MNIVELLKRGWAWLTSLFAEKKVKLIGNGNINGNGNYVGSIVTTANNTYVAPTLVQSLEIMSVGQTSIMRGTYAELKLSTESLAPKQFSFSSQIMKMTTTSTLYPDNYIVKRIS